MHPSSILGEASKLLEFFIARHAIAHFFGKAWPALVHPVTNSHRGVPAKPPHRRQIYREHGKAKGDHPKPENREESQKTANDQRNAKRNPQQRMAWNIHLVAREIDLCHDDPFFPAGPNMGLKMETTKCLFVEATLCYMARNIPR